MVKSGLFKSLICGHIPPFLTLQIAASGFVPGGAMTPSDVATIMAPEEIGQARRGLRNTGFWAVDTGGAALDTYVVVAPVSYGVSGALSRGSTTNLSPEARFYLQELEQNAGQVVVPPGRISARIISEISAETGAEVGLVRLHSGERVMTIGYIQEGKLFIPLNTRRIIAHTHPSGNFRFGFSDVLELTENSQRSSVIINLSGEGRRLFVSDSPYYQKFFR